MIKEQYNELLNEKLFRKNLSNGLEIIILPKPSYVSTHAYFFTQYGSNNNNFVVGDKTYDMPKGIAHFLEHKIFEDSEKSIFEEFSKNSASVNAYTNFVSTCYLFSCTDNYHKNLGQLLQFVQNPYLTDENVEKEKGIIGQEIRMYDDNPDWRVYFNTLQAMYHDHPVKYDIAGTVESVNKTTKEDLTLCYNSFYVPQNMKVFVTGDVSIEDTIKTVESNLNDQFVNPASPVKTLIPQERNSVFKKKIVEEMEVSVPTFYVGYKDIQGDLSSKVLLKNGIVTSLLLDIVFGKTGKIYQELYKDGLINSSFGYEYTFEKGYSHALLGGESKNPEQAYEMITKYLSNYDNDVISGEIVERSKRKMIGRFLNAYNSIEYIGKSYVGYLSRGLDLFDYLEVLQSLNQGDFVQRFKELFRDDNNVLSIVKPKS